MTALAKDRKTTQYGPPPQVAPSKLAFAPAIAATLYAGGMLATNASGLAVAASADATLKIWGVCMRQTVQANGDTVAPCQCGVFWMNNGAGVDAIGAADVGNLCYASDDNTVNKTDAGGTRPAAGKIVQFDSTLGVAVFLGETSLYANNPELVPSSTTAFRARGVATANVAALATFTVAGNDGITFVAGDIVILIAQTTAAQNGPYVVGTVGAGVAPLTRPDWWPAAGVMKSGLQIKVGGEGTVFKNTTWQAMIAADTFTVDTTDPKLYPLQVSGQTALVAGTFTISVPVFSQKTNVDLVRQTANTCTATTGGYHPTVAGATGLTPGVQGTGSIVVQATVAAGTINNADISTLNWTVTNQP
jgi:hypothetical protein